MAATVGALRRGRAACLATAAILLLAAACEWVPPADGRGGLTWLELTDAGTCRTIAAAALPAGTPVVLSWMNSLFRLRVTETFVARDGRLDLTRVAFAEPSGPPPPVVSPTALDDLYHTGGPFRVEGLARPVTQALFRVGEIGDPVLAVGFRLIRLKDEVGFGGAVRLEVRRPRWQGGPGEMLAWLRDRPAGGTVR
jgi:hypothetical protein